MLVLLLAD